MNYKKNYEKKILKELFQEMKFPALWHRIETEDEYNDTVYEYNDTVYSDRFRILLQWGKHGGPNKHWAWFIFIKQKQKDDFLFSASSTYPFCLWKILFRKKLINLKYNIKMEKGWSILKVHIDNSLSGGELSDLEKEGGE